MSILQILEGKRLVTAEILYRMPDHRDFLQMYYWQEYDLIPDLPELRKFLKFWREKLDGPLVHVTFAVQGAPHNWNINMRSGENELFH